MSMPIVMSESLPAGAPPGPTRGGARSGHGSGMPAAVLAGLFLVGACSPTVRVEAPDRPIEINLNVRIDQEVRITVDRELEEAIRANPDIF